MRTLLLLVAASAFSVPSARAAGDGRTPVAVVLARFQGAVPEPQRATIAATLNAAVAAQGYQMVDDRLRDETLAGDARLASCLESVACKLELGERLNADLVVSAAITRGAAPSVKVKPEWVITVAMLPLDVRRLGASDVRRCPACGPAELEPIATSLVGEVMAAERGKPRAQVVVRSRPSGAEVLIDDQRAGVTELRRAVYAGPHAIAVTLGPCRAEGSFDAAPGATVELDADPARGTIKQHRAGGGGGGLLRPLGVAALVTGVAAVAGGIALLAIHHRGTCTLVAPSEQCPQRYETLGGGLTLTLAGAAVAALGGVLIALGGRRGEPAVTLLPSLAGDGAGVAAVGRF